MAETTTKEEKQPKPSGLVRLRYIGFGERIMRSSDFSANGIDSGIVRFNRDGHFIAEVPEEVANFLQLEDGADAYEVVPDDETLAERQIKARNHR